MQFVGGVGLSAQAAQQPADDLRLVPGADQHGVAIGHRRGLRLLPGPQQPGDRDIDKLIKIADQKRETDHKIHGFQCFHRRSVAS